MSRLALSAVAIAALTLTACAPEASDSGGKNGPPGFAQDMWIFDQIVVVNAEDEYIDLTELIVANFDGETPDSTVELMDGVTFYEFAALNPRIIDTNVDSTMARTDVEMTAGFIETENGRDLTILASPQSGTRVPIYFKDMVKFDLSFLDHLIQPGDPVLFDYAFVQAFPTLDTAENGMSSLELLRHRMSENSIQYYAASTSERSNAPQSASLFTQELGVVLAGSRWVGYPAKSDDMMNGLDQGIRDCAKKTRSGPLDCVKEFLDTFEDGAAKSWELIDGQLDFVAGEVEEGRKEEDAIRFGRKYVPPVKPAEPAKCTPPPGDPDAGEGEEENKGEAGDENTSITPQCPKEPPPGEGGPDSGDPLGTVGGDPHFRTFDGKRFSMQGVGEYVAASHDSLTVQIRTHTVGTNVTSLSAVALGFGEHTMTIEAAQLHLDGKLVTDEVIEIDGVRVVNKNHIVTVQFKNGQLVRVINTSRWALDLEIWNPVSGQWSGMLGNADGDPANDIASRSGKVFTGTPTFEQIHHQFSESWRISQKESLFHYADGENTETFTDRSLPAQELTVDDLPAEHRTQAERMCRAAGIQNPDIFLNCVLDYGVLGELDDAKVPGQWGVVLSAINAERAEDFAAGRVSLFGHRVPVNVEGPNSGKGVALPPKGNDAEDHSSWLVTGTELLGATKARAGITCSAGGNFGPVWGGNDAYAMTSSVCTAAVHSGAITRAKGGHVMPNRLHEAGENIDYSGFDGFVSYLANGVTSKTKPAGPGFTFSEWAG